MHGKHYRTIVGVLLMAISIPLGIAGLTQHREPVTTLIELIHVWLYPVLLFGSGLALFNRESFKDVVLAGRRVIRRRSEDK